MYYAYNKIRGCIPCNTREEAIQVIQKQTKDHTETSNNNKITFETILGNGVGAYAEYLHAYEAVILYIIKRANQEYPDYLTKKKVGQIFTMTMLRWYCTQMDGYTREKPIRAGKPKQYKGQVGFSAFDRYYDNIKRNLKFRENKDGFYVLWTEIELEILEKLVDSSDMIRIIKGCVRDSQYPKNCQRTINNLYKLLSDKYKTK